MRVLCEVLLGLSICEPDVDSHTILDKRTGSLRNEGNNSCSALFSSTAVPGMILLQYSITAVRPSGSSVQHSTREHAYQSYGEHMMAQTHTQLGLVL